MIKGRVNTNPAHIRSGIGKLLPERANIILIAAGGERLL
jgi:hypothetical protein